MQQRIRKGFADMIKKNVFPQRNRYPTTIYSDAEDTDNKIPSTAFFSSGEYCFRYVPNWAEIPDDIWGYMLRGITTDQEDNVYATVGSPDLPILMFSPQGKLLRRMGRALPAGTLHGISISPDGTLWVADTANNAVFHLDQEDRLLGFIQNGWQVENRYYISASEAQHMSPSREGHTLFNRPTRAIPLPDGGLAVSDGYGHNALRCFNADGTLKFSLDAAGTRPGEFHLPHSLCLDGRGRIWVCDRENARVQLFDQTGSVLQVIDGLFPVFDVWTDQTAAYVLEGDGRINIFDLGGTLQAQVGHWHCGDLIAHAMCGNSKSDLFFADFGLKEIFKLERM